MRPPVFSMQLALSVLAGRAAPDAPMQGPPRKTGSRTPYTKPLMSPGAQFGALPPAVQNTVRAEAGSADILDVVKDTGSGRVFYTIYFRKADLFPPLYVAPDGSVLNPDLTVAVAAPRKTSPEVSTGSGMALKLSDLPPKVVKALQERAPHAELASIETETWGDRLVYIVSFKDPAHHPDMHLTADGSILKESQR